MRFHSERTELKLEIRGGQIHLAVGKYVRMGAENSPTSSSVGVADLSARWKAFAYLILFSIYRIILVIRGGNGFTDDGVGERERERERFSVEEEGRKGEGWRWLAKEEVYNKACRVQDTWWLAAVIKRVQRSSLFSAKSFSARKVGGEAGCCSRVRSNVNPPPSCPVSARTSPQSERKINIKTFSFLSNIFKEFRKERRI